MNVYIYDDFLNHRKFDSRLAQIETRITDLGLNGKIIRLGLLKNINDAVDSEIKRGAKTIIAVGNNHTLNKIVNSILKSDHPQAQNIPVGIIPIGENNDIAKYLGIDSWQTACDVLSARRLEKLDVGKINDDFFIVSVVAPNKSTLIEIDKKYSLESAWPGNVYILNGITETIPKAPEIKSHPQDERLELFIYNKAGKLPSTKNTNNSCLTFSKIIITNPDSPVVIDGLIKKETPCEISLGKKKISYIVGKERGF